MGKEFSISAFGVQTVKNDFHIVILRVADFSFLPFSFLLLRSQHRHPLLSVWIFFVILEAVFVVSCFSFLNSTCGRPSTAYLFTASQVPCHYSHWDKEWLLPSHEGISIQHFTGCNCLRVPSFPRSDIPIMGHLYVFPLSLYLVIDDRTACNDTWTFITTNFTHPQTPPCKVYCLSTVSAFRLVHSEICQYFHTF